MKRVGGGSGGFINSLINKLPIELHLPGYNFCGPGTKLHNRLARGDKGVNLLDEACREHDISYSQNKELNHRHQADNVLLNKAWERVLSNNSSLGEKANAYLVLNAMKAKLKLGMSLRKVVKKKKVHLRNVIKDVRKMVKLAKPTNDQNAIAIALKASKKLIKSSGKRLKLPRVIPVPKKIGGILPLIPIFAGLSALGALSGGAAGIAKAVNDAKSSKKQLNESERHNKLMEAIALKGRGLYLQPYKKGFGLYLKPKN